MKIGELSEQSGLSIDTLRYYEKIGLIDPPPRNRGGWRDYDPDILRWLEFLGRMKLAGMSIEEMVEYANLRRKGGETLRDRRQMLETRRHHVAKELKKLQEIYEVLEEKIGLYRNLEDGKNIDPVFVERALRTRT